MTTVLVAGEINVDLICSGYDSFPQPGKEVLVDDFCLTLGSSSAICAMGLAKLGLNVRFVGKVGADPWGEYCVQTMREAGIDVTRVQTDSRLKTGVTVSITSQRDRALVSYLGSVGSLQAEDVDDDALRGADHLHISSYFLQRGLQPGCGNLLDRAARKGLCVSLDPGFDPSELWDSGLLAALARVHLFFPNEVELLAVTRTNEIVEALRALDNDHTRTVATLGSRGCATLNNGELLEVPPFPINAVDSTGAGDSFNAGFLHAWLRDLPIIDCMRWGSANAALSTRCLGGTLSQGTAADVQSLLAGWRAA